MKKVLFLFGELNDLDVDWLVGNGSTLHIAKGDTLIEEGKPIKGLFVVLEGLFEIQVERGGKQAIGRMGTGEVLGEISFIDSRPPTTTALALADSTVFAIPRDQLAAKLKQDTGFAARFYRALALFLSHRLRVLTLKYGADGTGGRSETPDHPDELEDGVLSGVYMAGKRFERMLKRLTVS